MSEKLGNYIVNSLRRINNMHWQITKEIVSDSRLYSSYGADKSIIDRWTKEQMAFAISDLWSFISLYKKALVEKSKDDPLKDASFPGS